MPVLAIETSSRRGSVALFEHGALVRESVFPDGLIHGREIAVRIGDTLRECRRTPRDLVAIALGVGPGSFTGIRVAVTTAKTMAYALGIPVVTESSLRVAAANALGSGATEAPELAGEAAVRVLTVIDARQGAYFWAVHEVSLRPGATAEGVRAVIPDGVDEPARIAAAIRDLGGAGLVIGDGAQAYSERHDPAPWRRGPAAWDLPAARRLGELAAGRIRSAVFDHEAVHRLEPAYLRATEAERKLAARSSG